VILCPGSEIRFARPELKRKVRIQLDLPGARRGIVESYKSNLLPLGRSWWQKFVQARLKCAGPCSRGSAVETVTI
jgi:hypothetical protein